MFADFTFYKEDYYGFKITDEAKFNYYSSKATDKINSFTMGQTVDLTTDEVKKCCCAVADILFGDDGNSTKNVTSKTSGKQSETYAVSSNIKSSDTAIFEVMSECLFEYMNRSVYSD